MAYDTYDNPLIARYASREMASIFSPRVRIETWRRLWLALAESQRELGLPITRAQIDDLRRHLNDIDWRFAEAREREIRHDVMAHIHAYAKAARKAAAIIHLGATSYDIVDNADLIIMRSALRLICRKLAVVVINLGDFARAYRNLPTLGLTHYQPAQPTTVGKRAALWAQDFALDLRELEKREAEMAARGIVGATGTQASFLELFGGDGRKVERLNRLVCRKMGFDLCLSVASQTYTRKIDTMILASLAGIGESAHKFAVDVRLLAGRKEIEEPFEKKQVGSSAMAYKRNPMRCERICSLARWLMTQPLNSAFTHAAQWLERTLDDSAGRRLYIPQAFLAADAILELCANVASGLVVYPLVIKKALAAELPFMATENILMAAVQAGGDRQALHERIRVHSQAAAEQVKMSGKENDLLERLQRDPAFAKIAAKLPSLLDPLRYIGRAPQPVSYTHLTLPTIYSV